MNTKDHKKTSLKIDSDSRNENEPQGPGNFTHWILMIIIGVILWVTYVYLIRDMKCSEYLWYQTAFGDVS